MRVAERFRVGLTLILLAACCVWPCGCRDTESPPAVPAGVVRLEGTPEEIGARHGTALRDGIEIMIGEYVGADVEAQPELLARVRAMKPSLPRWYRRELAACAKAAGVDEDMLLYAQCEGDIKGLGGCTVYAAFGEATHNGRMEIGRNFDYWGLESTEACCVVLAFIPKREDGHAFVSVGWAGILGGWTLVNERGLFVANTLGGGFATNPEGVPTLILARMIVQKAATVDEAIEIVRRTPRMRGQGLLIAQAGDAPDAAVVTYDAETVDVERQTAGFAFDTSIGTDPVALAKMLRRPERAPIDTIRSAGTGITLHSVAIRPHEHRMWVAHGRSPSAHRGQYAEYDLKALLKR